MSRLTWIETDHGWRAGPYEIELAAPELWVCSRRSRRGDVDILETAGSLNALKRRIDSVEQRRHRLRRSLGYLVGFVASALLLAVVLVSDVASATIFVVVLVAAGLFTVHRAIDAVIDRSWESIRLNYQ